MRIPNQLPQFKREKALILVTGKQDAIFYSAYNGELDRLDAFKIPRPKYSDNEGHYKVRGKGTTLSTGATRELRDEDIIKDFVHELKARIKKMNESFSKFYLFVPSQNKNVIKKALPKMWLEKLDAEVPGNFYYRSPLELLEKIKDSQRKK